ncbi:hypothetical protein FB563_3441 [Streptomyces puniciscabiei]|uniref:Uncharacterized protein n=1 Tax=Streptomyces puniciscabiei TaxID=164348 RepID=A0A542UH45_9ACTN|nr:hypothetical protein [Streptomyces puniciscabiei]TQK98415.1 hypothetical protein FB563_3441 [Streptomyces puniciscabiei]
MESDKSTPENIAAARAALDGVSEVRSRIADRVASPWWYHAGLGLSVATVFASIDVGGSLVPSGVVAGGVLMPLALSWTVARSRGISVSQAVSTPSARGLNGAFLVLLILLGGLGLTLKMAAGLPGAMTAAGLAAAALTIWTTVRNDVALRRDLRSGA